MIRRTYERITTARLPPMGHPHWSAMTTRSPEPTRPKATYIELLRAQEIAASLVLLHVGAPPRSTGDVLLELRTRIYRAPRADGDVFEIHARPSHLLRLRLPSRLGTLELDEEIDQGHEWVWEIFDPFAMAGPRLVCDPAVQPGFLPTSRRMLVLSCDGRVSAQDAEGCLHRTVSLLLGGYRETDEAVMFLKRMRGLRGALETLRFWDVHYHGAPRNLAEIEYVARRMGFDSSDWEIHFALSELVEVCAEEDLREAVNVLTARRWDALATLLAAARDEAEAG